MDAPERIWARPEHEDESSYGGFWIKEPVEAGATEYTRTDLSDAAVEAALREAAAVAGLAESAAKKAYSDNGEERHSGMASAGAVIGRRILALIPDTGALDRALERAREEGRREGQIRAGAVFATSDAEGQWVEDMENACPACGGSGHKGDAADHIEVLEAKLAKAVALLGRADQQIVWESLGLGNTFAEEVEATLAELTATKET